MQTHPRLQNSLLALGLLGLIAFLGPALITYDPADPPTALVFPAHAEPTNICGRAGAVAANLLFQSLGLGAWYLLITLGVLLGLIVTKREPGEPVCRATGWTLSLIGLTTLAALAPLSLSPGPAIGAGGYLGAAARGLLEANFALLGSYVLALSVLAAGLLLCTDLVLVTGAGWLVKTPSRQLISVGRRVAAGRGGALSLGGKRSDLMDSPDADGLAGPRLKSRRGALQNATDLKPGSGPSTLPIPTTLAATAATAAASADADVEEEAEAEDVPSSLRIKRPGQTDRDRVMDELDAASQNDGSADYELPPIELLEPGEFIESEDYEKEVRKNAKVLEKTFESFGFQVRVVEIETGPVISQYEVELEAGLRLSKITSLADDLAIALRVPSVRIVAPIPGKNTVGIEVPNHERQMVRIREVMEAVTAKQRQARIPIYLGKDVAGNPMVVDLTTLPHLLIAGRTGTGKSVCLNTLIVSMIMSRRPDEVKMLLIDPKMVELTPYKRLPHLMHPVVTDMRKAEAILAWAVEKMEERYALLARAGVRHIGSYNQLGEEELMERLEPENDEERSQIPLHLPYIVIVADEMADLMMTSPKEVEHHIIRLAQKSRAVGIHLVLATQKPTVDVITGLIKSNLPARIAFQVASRTDSRVVLDEMGADKLLGNGDMLFLWPGTSTLLRGQGTYVSDEEINRVVDFVATTEPQFVKELVQLKTPAAGEGGGDQWKSRDELYQQAIDVVVREGRGSVSLLQRSLGIGYGRAARLIDFMAEDGFVGQYAGSQAREVLLTVEQWEEKQAEAEGGSGGKRGGSKLSLPAPAAAPQARKAASVPWEEAEDDADEEESDLDETGEADDWDEESDDDDVDDSEEPRRSSRSA
jgi:S-DNA-T family DNA segregation ATPase FtsK/SpoIIIE